MCVEVTVSSLCGWMACVCVQDGRGSTAPSPAPVEPGGWAATRRVCVPTGRPATQSTGLAPVLPDGRTSTATTRVL